MPRSLGCIAVAALLAACGGSSSSPTATISVTSPAAGSSVALGTDSDKSVPVAFTTSNFTLADQCAGNANCGHIHLLIDGAACNPSGSPYNNSATVSPATAKFASCASPAGSHTVALELHHQDHTPVNDSRGAVIQTSVAFTTH